MKNVIEAVVHTVEWKHAISNAVLMYGQHHIPTDAVGPTIQTDFKNSRTEQKAKKPTFFELRACPNLLRNKKG